MRLADLFEGRRQLIVYRAFYAPNVTTYSASGGAYPERACVGCSFGERPGRKPGPPERAEHDARVCLAGVDERHGHSAFIREGDRIFRTYFTDARGDEHLGTTWSYLDITALGRQEEWENSPEGYPQTPPYQWWNHHDAYGKEA